MSELDWFLNQIHQAYVDARNPVCADKLCGSTIERGRSRTISGIAEDYFAELLYRELGNDHLHFFVDQPLVGGIHKVFPDVIIARPCEEDNCFEIVYMLDLKMDVGYHRDITTGEEFKRSYVAKAKSLLDNLALLKSVPPFELSTKSGSKKARVDCSVPRYYFSLHPQASYDEVIITSKNAGNKEKEQKLIERAKDPDCNIWVLSIGDHPNEYKDTVNMYPLHESWMLLLQKICNILK